MQNAIKNPLAQLNALERIAFSIKSLLDVKRHQAGLPPLGDSDAVSEEIEKETEKKETEKEEDNNDEDNNDESPGPSTRASRKAKAGRKRSAGGALKGPAYKKSKAAGKRRADWEES
ncbi:hypothetical protein K469DRAFT_689168 [Zopfia rhizophila CBS 207.26]|uniref:Uncharacterized protein n=1 Tax=Zopfia rhizophila CBS 207.26 TaxID=1314779 RepID=A0A6A6EW46_9PEZI|nr:hypothetical protein K469DRAFT_689168 [Zopfia rhizophila CBS 207.26]